jgi:hypothetical protein
MRFRTSYAGPTGPDPKCLGPLWICGRRRRRADRGSCCRRGAGRVRRGAGGERRGDGRGRRFSAPRAGWRGRSVGWRGRDWEGDGAAADMRGMPRVAGRAAHTGLLPLVLPAVPAGPARPLPPPFVVFYHPGSFPPQASWMCLPVAWALEISLSSSDSAQLIAGFRHS